MKYLPLILGVLGAAAIYVFAGILNSAFMLAQAEISCEQYTIEGTALNLLSQSVKCDELED